MFHVGQGTSWPMSDTLLPSHCHANIRHRDEIQSGNGNWGIFSLVILQAFHETHDTLGLELVFKSMLLWTTPDLIFEFSLASKYFIEKNCPIHTSPAVQSVPIYIYNDLISTLKQDIQDQSGRVNKTELCNLSIIRGILNPGLSTALLLQEIFCTGTRTFL